MKRREREPETGDGRCSAGRTKRPNMDSNMLDLNDLIHRIVPVRAAVPPERAAVIGLSGIDGSGKGYVSRRLADLLTARGYRVALINTDGWLNLPHVRFREDNAAEHFYHNAIRFDALFSELLEPLRAQRSIDVEVDHAEEKATEFVKRRYAFENIDIVIVEGIYLFKRAYLAHYDVKAWLVCGFATALKRAIARAQEGLPPDETVAAYRRLYFPAQEIHFRLDRPAQVADVIIMNDAAAVSRGPIERHRTRVS